MLHFTGNQNKFKRGKNKKRTHKKQIAPECFVFVSFLIIFSFLFCFFARETSESQICSFPQKKRKHKIHRKETKQKQTEANCDRVLCIFVF